VGVGTRLTIASSYALSLWCDATREVARRIGRDVKGVHGDRHALLAVGLLDRTADRRLEFPYDAVKVEFTVGPGA
jgi:predicted transcriptional regulator